MTTATQKARIDVPALQASTLRFDSRAAAIKWLLDAALKRTRMSADKLETPKPRGKKGK